MRMNICAIHIHMKNLEGIVSSVKKKKSTTVAGEQKNKRKNVPCSMLMHMYLSCGKKDFNFSIFLYTSDVVVVALPYYPYLV